MTRARLSVLAIVAACGACHAATRTQSTVRTGTTDRRAVEAEIRSSLAAWVDAFRRDDKRAMAQVWAPDILGWAPGQPPYTYAQVEPDLRAAPQPPRVRPEIQLAIEEVLVSDDLALVRDIWTFRRRFGSDSVLTQRLLGYEIWRPQPDGKWRIARYLSAPEPWVRTP